MNQSGAPPDRESTTGIPRWVKVVGIIVVVLLLLFVVLQLVGGGHQIPQHAPALAKHLQ